MNEKKQIEAMARLDGDIKNDELGIKSEESREAMRCGYVVRATSQLQLHDCDYMHDHTTVQRVIDGLSGEYKGELACYKQCLWFVFGFPFDLDLLFKATCPQKVEAILKAKGVWE